MKLGGVCVWRGGGGGGRYCKRKTFPNIKVAHLNVSRIKIIIIT